MLQARPVCECSVTDELVPTWFMCGACYPKIVHQAGEVLAQVSTNAARVVFARALGETLIPDYAFIAEDRSLIVGNEEAEQYVRSLPGSTFERGTIDEDGFWIADGE